MRNATGQSITIDQAADLIEGSTETKWVTAGGMRASWRVGEQGDFILVQGANGEFLKIED